MLVWVVAAPVHAPFPQLMATRSAPLFTVKVVFAPVKLMSCAIRSIELSVSEQWRQKGRTEMITPVPGVPSVSG